MFEGLRGVVILELSLEVFFYRVEDRSRVLFRSNW